MYLTEKLVGKVIPVLILLGQGGQAFGQEVQNVWMERHRASAFVGAYFADYDSLVRLASSQTGTGTVVDLESDFGLDSSKNQWVIHGDYRFSPRHRLDFIYYDLSRSGSNDVEREIEFGDITFPVGATVDTTFDYAVAKLTYSYSLYQTETIDFALAGGVYTAIYDVDATNRATGEREGDSSTAPFPIFGFRASFLPHDRWSIDSYLEYVEISTSDSRGDYIDFTLAAQYRFGKHLGAGLAFNMVEVEGEDKKSDDEGFLDYSGLLAFLTWNFH